MESTKALRESSRCWAVLIACCVVDAFGFTLGTTGYSVFLTPIRTSLGLTMFEAQMYNTACMFCTIISTLIGARLMKIGAGKVVAVCSVLIIIGYNLMGFFPSVVTIAIAGCLGGLAYPLLSIYTMPVVIGNWFYKRQGTWISVCLAMSGLGGLVFSPLATSLIAAFGWQAALSICSAIMIPLCLLGVFLIRTNPIDLGILPHGATMSDIEDSASASKEQQGAIDRPGLTLKAAAKTPAFALLIVVLFCIGLQSGYAGNMNPMIQASGYSAAIAGVGLSAMSLGNLVCKPIVGILRDHCGAMFSGMCGYGAFIIGMALVLMGMASYNEGLIIAAAFVTGLGGGSGLVMPSLYTKDTFGSKDFDRIYSIQMGVRSAGCAVAAPLAGILFDATGGYAANVIFWIVVSALVIVVGCMAVISGRKRWAKSIKFFGRPAEELPAKAAQ